MRLVIALLLLWAFVTSVIASVVYVAWNGALAPWMEWRTMPASVALAVAATVALLSLRVRRP